MNNKPKMEMEIVNWREKKTSGTLQGFLSVVTASGLQINDCSYHRREAGGSRWIGMPAKSFTKNDGSTGWVPMVEFANPGARARFTEKVLKALDEYLKQPQPAVTKPAVVEEPF